MTIVDGVAPGSYQGRNQENREFTSLIGGSPGLSVGSPSSLRRRRRLRFQHSMDHWMPDDEDSTSWRGRIFLLITEPETSVLSAVFYVVLMSAIFASNVVMVMQTMDAWQFTPDDCVVCGGYVTGKLMGKNLASFWSIPSITCLQKCDISLCR